jgi:hypothetical protein
MFGQAHLPWRRSGYLISTVGLLVTGVAVLGTIWFSGLALPAHPREGAAHLRMGRRSQAEAS